MSLLQSLSDGLRSLFRKEQINKELDEELNGFLEMAAEEKMKRGMSRKDALRAVRRLLVGRITTSVKGMTSRRSSPPTSQARPPSNHRDARAKREPIRASGTCISVPRL
jgi:hypothetical protein